MRSIRVPRLLLALVTACSFGVAGLTIAATASPGAPMVAQPQAKPTSTCRGNGVKACTSTTTTPSTTTSSTTSSTSSGGFSCTVQLGGACGAYSYAGIPNSNGYNTYVANQNVGAQSGTTQVLSANNPGDWQLVANDVPYGYTGVQSYPDVQQLFNNWCGAGWGNCNADTPIDSLSALKISYAETSPTGANDIYQFAPDLWLDNYGSDIMFWVDIHGRCNEGAFGGTVLGHATIAGQAWTVHRYGNAGAEIIFVLDGPGGTGTCAQQNHGTIDIKAGVDWLVANKFVNGAPVMGQLNTGWEITSADHATFTMSSYSITATL